MTEFIEISWTSGSLDEARKISRRLVTEGLVACAQIIPWVESVYMWDKQLETMQESKILLKTTLEKYTEVKQIIEENCNYEIPEITFRNIDGGNKAYLDWMKESTISLI
jgi:periplasmic divalent cation tolerance protein